MKDITGYEGIYAITEDGKVWSYPNIRKGFWRKIDIKWNGFQSISLVKEGVRQNYSVHKLVAQTYLPNPENKQFVRHKDFDITNNNVNNLEWISIQETPRYIEYFEGDKLVKEISSSTKVKCIETGEIFKSAIAASLTFGGSEESVGLAIWNKTIANGYHWEYVKTPKKTLDNI